MAELPVAPPIRALIARSRSLVALPFVRPTLGWRRLPRTYGTAVSSSASWFLFLRLSFAIMVLLPTIGAVVYTGLIASPIYISEARIAIRESLGFPAYGEGGFGGENEADNSNESGRKGSPTSMPQGKGVVASLARGLSGLLGGLGGASHTQAPFILANYAKSLDYVAKLDEGGYLRGFFTRQGIDPWSALKPDASIEKLRDYWNHRITVAVDRRSGIVFIKIGAFSPQDAQILAERVLNDGEHLLNDILVRSRTDAVQRAQEQLAKAKQQYTTALVRQQEWRMNRRAVDPVLAAETLGTSLMRLEQERIDATREIRVLERLSVRDAPALGVLRDRLRAIDSEIAGFKDSLAKTDGKVSAVDALAAYEESELDVRFAEMLQAIAVSGLQEADRRARGQSAFVNVFVPPSLPASPAGPSWWRATLFVFTMATIIWVNVTILIAVIRDHLR